MCFHDDWSVAPDGHTFHVVYVLAWFGKGVVSSIGSVARLMRMQLLPAVMQVGEQGSEHVHLQAVRWTI